MIGLLERRLDAIVYRAKFVPTVFAARQFVNHGHVKVNGKRVNIPSYRVKVGDVVEVKDNSKQMALVLEAQALGRARRARLHRGRHRQDDRQVRRASRCSPTCPIRCRWSRTWWSSSTRADRRRDACRSPEITKAACPQRRGLSCCRPSESRAQAALLAFTGDALFLEQPAAVRRPGTSRARCRSRRRTRPSHRAAGWSASSNRP